MNKVLPTHEECADKVSASTASPLEVFIYENEPAGIDDSIKFREQLCLAIGCYVEELNAEWKTKAEAWDALDKKISKFYVDEDGDKLPIKEGGDLADIGEVAAIAFGYL